MRDEEKAKERIIARVSNGVAFTLAELCESDPRITFFADRLIEKWRTARLIYSTLEGKALVWRLTDAGRAYVELLPSNSKVAESVGEADVVPAGVPDEALDKIMNSILRAGGSDIRLLAPKQRQALRTEFRASVEALYGKGA